MKTEDDFAFCEPCEELYERQNGIVMVKDLCEDCRTKVLLRSIGNDE